MGISIQGREIERIREFCYFGGILQKNIQIEKEKNARIIKARYVFYEVNDT